MAFESNWQTAMGGHLDLPTPGEGGAKPKSGLDSDKDPQPPKNYKPSTPEQRQKWNKFLDYLETKGVAGKPEMDARDKGIGKKYLQEFNKANPGDAINEEFVPTVQYESYLMRKKNAFPGLSPEQGEYAFKNMNPAWKNKPISPVDSWLGSYTSKQYYPQFERATDSGRQKFGVSFEDFVKGVDIPSATAKNK